MEICDWKRGLLAVAHVEIVDFPVKSVSAIRHNFVAH